MSEHRLRKTKRLPGFERLPLSGLRVFESVASHLSFSEAAEALHVTPAAVSQQIRSLEQYLRVPLFRRKGRSVTLTAEGELLLPGVRRGLTTLQQSMQQLRQDRLSGALRISTLASYLQKWLLPRLPRFHDRHPEIELSIHTSRTPVDFASSDFHAAIRMSTGPSAGLYSEKLMDEWFVPVCTRELLAKYGPLRDAEDLRRFPLLHSSDEEWSLWLQPAAAVAWQERGTAFDDSLTVLAGAEQGQGLALTRWSLAAEDLASGRIVQASERMVPCPRAYYFVCPEMYVTIPKVQQLLSWLREMAAAFPRPKISDPAVAQPPAAAPQAPPAERSS
jgi:LysR family transcriptional regulator, glycine cleavage system transcriptional activator